MSGEVMRGDSETELPELSRLIASLEADDLREEGRIGLDFEVLRRLPAPLPLRLKT